MSLLDLPSAIFVLVPVLGAFIASQFTQQGIKLANSIILQTGLVGTLIGLITMLGNMSDPGEIGPGLSIASLTILYALIASTTLCTSTPSKHGRVIVVFSNMFEFGCGVAYLSM